MREKIEGAENYSEVILPVYIFFVEEKGKIAVENDGGETCKTGLREKEKLKIKSKRKIVSENERKKEERRW